jgi:hypothetical protein
VFVNLTRMTIYLRRPDGSELAVPPSGSPAEATPDPAVVGAADGVPVALWGCQVGGLPEPQEGVWLLAARPVAEAAAWAGRADILALDHSAGSVEWDVGRAYYKRLVSFYDLDPVADAVAGGEGADAR